jgi:hypothetical protein
LIVLLVGTTARKGELLLLTIPEQQIVDELCAVVGVQSQQGKRQACAGLDNRCMHGVLAAITDGQAFCPGRSDVCHGQAIGVLAMGTLATVRHQINFHKAWHRIIPIRKGANRDLVFEQGAWFRRAKIRADDTVVALPVRGDRQ